MTPGHAAADATTHRLIQINASPGGSQYLIQMNARSYPPANVPSVADEWRRRAQRARTFASSLAGDPAEQRLLHLASEYEERTVEAEAASEPGR